MVRFHCPICHRTTDDAVIMHYVLWHPAALEERSSDLQIEAMLRQHFFPRQKDLVELLLTAVSTLVSLFPSGRS